MVCNYDYQYEYKCDPSWKRFKHKHCKLFAEYQEVEETIDDSNLFIFLTLLVIIPFNLIFTIAFIEDPLILIYTSWLIILLQLLFLIVMRKKFVLKNLFYIFKITQYVTSFFVLIFISIIFGQYQNACYSTCKQEKNYVIIIVLIIQLLIIILTIKLW